LAEFFGIREAAQYLGVEYKTVWRMVRKGDLPAAKIGGVYRIRKEDIDALFEARDRVPRGGAAIERCAYCGKEIAGPLDEGGRCQVCGAPICSTCWSLEGRHFCRQHVPAEHEQVAEAGAPQRCARCLRVLPEGAEAGTCRAPGCDAPLCSECWSHPEDRYCRAHAPTKEQKLAKARADLAAGAIPCLVTSVQAKRAELSFISRFDHKVSRIATMRNPIDGSLYRMSFWDQAHESGDQVRQVLDILGTGFLEKTVADLLPMNLWSRYTVPETGTRPGRGLVLEARCVSGLEAHLARGFDTAPISLEGLLPMLEAVAKDANAVRRPYVLGLASTTGWAEDAIGYVETDPSGHTYSHRYLLPCLIDLLTGEVHHDALDDRIQPFTLLFSLEVEGEVIERIIAYVDEYLITHHGLPVADISKEVGVGEEIVVKALGRLEASGTHRIEEIKGVGAVVIKDEETDS